MHAVIVIGTRPQIIKSAPIIKEAVRWGLVLDVVHTGQHCDYELSRVFLGGLGLPDPRAHVSNPFLWYAARGLWEVGSDFSAA